MCLYSKTSKPIKTDKPLTGYKWGCITHFNYYISPVVRLNFPFNKVLKDTAEEIKHDVYYPYGCSAIHCTAITSGYFHYSKLELHYHSYKVIIPRGTLIFNDINGYDACAKHIIIVNPDIIKWYQCINIWLYEKGILTVEWADFAAKLYSIYFKFKLPILLLGNKLSRLKSKIKKLNNF